MRSEHHPSPGDSAVGDDDTRSIDELLFELACGATALLVAHIDDVALGEATAALQDLAVTTVEDSAASARVAELQALQAGLGPRIQAAANGPLLVTNAVHFSDWLGQPLPTRPQMALCRCGASQLKPLCDGSPRRCRVPRRQGRQSGSRPPRQLRRPAGHDPRQSQHLPAFRLLHRSVGDRLPPRRGAVRHPQRWDGWTRSSAPSATARPGRLSYAIDGVEARDDVDYHGTREPAIEVSKDGPVSRSPAASRSSTTTAATSPATRALRHEHYALCRCGQSQNKPFCSGMHYSVNFLDPVPARGSRADASSSGPAGCPPSPA